MVGKIDNQKGLDVTPPDQLAHDLQCPTSDFVVSVERHDLAATGYHFRCHTRLSVLQNLRKPQALSLVPESAG